MRRRTYFVVVKGIEWNRGRKGGIERKENRIE